MAAPYVVLSLLAGFGLVTRVWPQVPALARLAGAFAVGVVLTAWVAFAAAWAAHGLGSEDATWHGVWVASVVDAALVAFCRDSFRRPAWQLARADLVGVAVALAVAAWIMRARLSGDPLTVSANTWGDTSLHLGIARSFSEGANFPPELPIFAGESIRYHFGFDFYAGSLERAGWPIGWAFNLPGALAFAAICVLLVSYARLLWRSSVVGVVAAVLFATNSSLAFLRYFEAEGSGGLRPSTVWNHVGYDGGGPYNGDEISIFMTLNPYLTQTHLMAALVVVLFVGLVVLTALREPGEPGGPTGAALVGAGILLGATFWLNGIVVVVMFGFCAVLFVVGGAGAWPARARRALPFLVGGALVSVPQLVWLNGGLGAGGSVSFHTGYLVEDFSAVDPGSWWDFTRYWWLNLGLALPLLVLAPVWLRRSDRALLLAVMSIFVIGNLVAFGRELGGHNHKVFNLWEILANLFVAYALVRLVALIWSRSPLRRALAATVAAGAAVLLLGSGLLDYMTLKNDPRYGVVGDRAGALAWIRDHTDRDAVFLTAYGEVYTAPTLAGRRVYLGGFAPWTAIMGYDNGPREQRIVAFYSAPDQATACRQLVGTGVDYIEVGYPELRSGAFDANPRLFPGGFRAAWSDGVYTYYDARASCPELGG